MKFLDKILTKLSHYLLTMFHSTYKVILHKRIFSTTFEGSRRKSILLNRTYHG